MNDIQLIKSGDDTYDWNFKDNDLADVNGNQRLLSAVIHNMLLRRNEIEPALYVDKGCLVHTYIKSNHVEDNIDNITESLKSSLNTIKGVSASSVEVETQGNNIVIKKIVLDKTDGREVVIHAI